MTGTSSFGLPVGAMAPDFALRDQFGQTVQLSTFRGAKAVVVVFYPAAFSGVCTGEMSALRSRLDEFLTFETEVLAISCDPVFSLRSFADADRLNFPLLSDFWPHGEVATAYGVFDADRGMPHRSSYVIGKDGVIRWSVHSPVGESRDLDEHLAQLLAASEA